MAKRELEPHINETLQKIGQRIRSLRREQGYGNYEDFAFTHGLPRTQMGRYEQGFDLQVSSLLKVIKALDMDIEDFFNEDFTNIKIKKISTKKK